ncbi:MAG: tetratricopeptide repeat protein [Candidatus Electrothrix sp. AR1]|nr:tetratricopeptide repeat protein [Candidatus Electrothrix sp. AR1]
MALRAVLLQLKDKGAKELLADLRKEFALLEGDESSKRILAALAVLDQGLPKEYGPVLQLIGLHRRFVDQDFLEQMLKNAEETTESIQPCFALLETAGLLYALGSNIFQMHPALQSHLERQHPAAESLQRTFVDVMSSVADELKPKEVHEQRSALFDAFVANFLYGVELGQKFDMKRKNTSLNKALASHFLSIYDYTNAYHIFESFIFQQKKDKNYKEETEPYHQLGIIALEQRNFEVAEKWYEKLLSIEKELGDEYGMARTFHQLGIIALERRNFAAAIICCNSSLEIKKKLGNEKSIANTYHQQGRIAQAQFDSVTAKKWYKKAVIIFEKINEKYNIANSYHELAIIYLDQNDLAAAEHWCNKSLMIRKKEENKYRLAPAWEILGSREQSQKVGQIAFAALSEKTCSLSMFQRPAL